MRGTRRVYRKLKRLILNQDVEIKVKKRLSQRARGFIEPDVDEILILKSQDVDEKSITLLHELLHHQYPQVENEEFIENSAKRIYEDLPKAEKGFLEFIVSPGDKF